MEYDFTVTHIAGIKNVLPDILSRFYEDEVSAESINQQICEKTISSILLSEKASLKEEPKEVMEEQLEKCHVLGHFGALAMHRSLVAQGFNWPGMLEHCKMKVKSCVSCQRYNIYQHGFHPLKSITASLPMDHVAVDLKELPKSDKGFVFILVIVDVASRFVFLHALENKEMETIAIKLLKTFCLAGFPKIIQSDQG